MITKSASHFHNNQRGQVIIEYVLMMVIVLSVSFMVQKYLNKSQFIQNFTIQPWARLSGMVECGVWKPCGVEARKPGLHANLRVLSLKSEETP